MSFRGAFHGLADVDASRLSIHGVQPYGRPLVIDLASFLLLVRLSFSFPSSTLLLLVALHCRHGHAPFFLGEEPI